MGQFVDRTGVRCGRLVPLRTDGKGKHGKHFMWLCQCDCGNTCRVATSFLRPSMHHIVSCGCYRRENSRVQIERTRKPCKKYWAEYRKRKAKAKRKKR